MDELSSYGVGPGQVNCCLTAPGRNKGGNSLLKYDSKTFLSTQFDEIFGLAMGVWIPWGIP